MPLVDKVYGPLETLQTTAQLLTRTGLPVRSGNEKKKWRRVRGQKSSHMYVLSLLISLYDTFTLQRSNKKVTVEADRLTPILQCTKTLQLCFLSKKKMLKEF
jgi:SH3-like domain-containing protein